MSAARPAVALPPQGPTVIASLTGWPRAEALATVEDVAAWFLRRGFGRRLEFLEQDVAAGTHTDPARCAEFPAVAVFARKARGGADEWLGFACGPQITGSRQFAAVVERVRSAGGLAA